MDRADGDIVEVLDVPLFFDVQGGSIHCPMVKATVGGVGTRLIIDTGATTQVFTIDLVDRAGIDRMPGESGTDVAGTAVASWDLEDVTVGLAGASFVPAHAAAIDGPPPFLGWGVGGFLSPQALWPEDTVVLDFVQRRLLVLAGDPEVSHRVPDSGHGELVVLAGAHQAAGTVGIEVAVSGHEPVVAYFDSGADMTEVSVRAVSGMRGTTAVSGHSVSGVALEAYELHGQVLDVANARLPVSVLAVRDQLPVPDGAPGHQEPDALIGMDLLAGTVLEISPRSRGRVRWIVSKHQTGG